MKALTQADELSKVGEKLTALKVTLRGAYLPSLAVTEVARQLRATSVALDLLADDLDTAQREAARRERQWIAA